MTGKRIVYYPGCFVNHFDHETGRSVVKILERNGFEVVIPNHACCGLTLFYSGDISYARKRATKLVSILSPLVEQGCDIVVSCPTCGYALKEIYPHLLVGEETVSVGEKTSFVSQYLLKLHREGRLRTDFRTASLSIAYHIPCHLRSQNLSTESAELMALVPGTSVTVLDRGCCGMGGTWGMHSKYQSEVSAEVGSDLFKAIEEADPQLIATDCAGCQIQIASHTNRQVTSPVRFLAEAYPPLQP